MPAGGGRRRSGFGLGYLHSRAEYRDVTSLGNFDYQRFLASFRNEELLELLAELGHVNAN